ncbi:hypothetical protein [Cohnella luojiensis]|uniref:Uncharacterized protein n=1 Tax=Cohnella luojiensis TaxID=652876 RepID=A0A4Y8M0Z4_9BACL|nr:hypothetical protein [Cohnella luojiensis]TFE26105.1 hypothetical protein E2980_12290 [Cohnella luojiensis]
MISILVLVKSIIFLALEWAFRVTKEEASGLGIWMLPAILMVVLGTVAYYLVRAFRAGRV